MRLTLACTTKRNKATNSTQTEFAVRFTCLSLSRNELQQLCLPILMYDGASVFSNIYSKRDILCEFLRCMMILILFMGQLLFQHGLEQQNTSETCYTV